MVEFDWDDIRRYRRGVYIVGLKIVVREGEKKIIFLFY